MFVIFLQTVILHEKALWLVDSYDFLFYVTFVYYYASKNRVLYPTNKWSSNIELHEVLSKPWILNSWLS